MKKYELTKTIYNDKVTFYENDFYKIIVEKYSDKDLSFIVKKNLVNLPTIYINEDWKKEKNNEYNIKSIEIQTTSHGAMEVEEVEYLIENYRIAIETVKEIKKIFNIIN